MADRCIVTSRLRKPIKQRLIDVTSFTLSKSDYSRSVLLTNALIILVLFFHIVWIVELIKFQKHSYFHFLFVVSLFLPPFVCEFSPVIILTAGVESTGNFTHKAYYHYYCLFPCLEVG